MSLILYAVPGFFLLIAIELIAERVRGTNYYRLNDSLTSLATGTINQVVNVSKALVPFTVYVWLYQEFALFTWNEGWMLWIVAFVLYDLCYYWNHRFGHEMNILWASHVVHHSSEEYNLSTALRQTGTSFLSFVFYMPLALLGFDPLLILTVGSLNLIYQFWVHTRHIGKLGWMEWVLVTPSNHRGHHAQNTIYIDKNYGGVFILWDRLFGTYQEEKEDDLPIFGIRGAVKSWNPIWVNAQVYAQLCADAWRTSNLWHKLTIWFRRTGWRPPDVEAMYPLEKNDDLTEFIKFDTQSSRGIKIHCFIQWMTTAALGIYFSLKAGDMASGERLMMVGFILWSTVSIGALFEGRHFAGVLEFLRLGVLCIALLFWAFPSQFSQPLLAITMFSVPMFVYGRFAESRVDQQEFVGIAK